MTHRLTLAAAARSDVANILRRSAADFGPAARERYAALIATALADLRADPACLGSAERSEILPGVRTYHLSHCRRRAGQPAVGRPRHLLAYRAEGDGRVVVLRVLHDAMELEEQLRG